MKLYVKPSRLQGEIAVPGSKSHTIRGIAAALLSTGRCRLYAPLESADTRSALAAAQSFGAAVTETPEYWEITGTGGKFAEPGSVIDMGNSGTGLRMLSALAATQNFPVTFDGDESLRTRLMSGLLEAVSALGAKTVSANGKCPLTIQGPVRSGRAELDGTTSQYLTSLLFALPTVPGKFKLELPFLNEQPYIHITLDWLRRLGIEVSHSADLLFWEIPGGQTIPGFDRVIPADFSTAAFPLLAGAIAGDGVTIRNLDFSDAQGDKAVFGYFEAMGASIVRGGELLVRPGAWLEGRELDLNSTPDALPAMAVAGAFARGETRLVNAPQARVKETDRIAVMAQELGKMNVPVRELPDGMIIQGCRPAGAKLDGHGDHRIVMALACAALAANGESVIDGAEAAVVTYPGFFDDFRKLGAQFELAE